MWRGFFSRFIPGTSTLEEINARISHSPVSGRGGFAGATSPASKSEIFAMSGGQLQLLKIARRATAVQLYPDAGTGILPTQTGGAANGNALLKLASGVLQTQAAGLTPVGMLVVITSGVALGEVRRIESWVSGTQVATVGANWVTPRVPAAADTYDLLIDCEDLNTILVKGECSVSTNYPTLRFVGWPVPLSMETTTPVALIPPTVWDSATALVNTTIALRTIEGGAYCQTEPWTMDSRGLMGFQVYLQAVTNGGDVSLWAGAR